MQRLGEGDVIQEKPIVKKSKKDKEKQKNNNDKPTPYKTEQQKLSTTLKERQSTFRFFTKI